MKKLIFALLLISTAAFADQVFLSSQKMVGVSTICYYNHYGVVYKLVVKIHEQCPYKIDV